MFPRRQDAARLVKRFMEAAGIEPAQDSPGRPTRSSLTFSLCFTAFVFASDVACHLNQEAPIRALALLLVTLLIHTAHQRHAWASAYSPETSGSTNGCDGSRLHDADLTFASLIVPCGAHVRFCIRNRCVIGTRKDSGPYIRGRLFDLNLGLVRALGFNSCAAFGVRQVVWSRV